jgi:hypothetical protein
MPCLRLKTNELRFPHRMPTVCSRERAVCVLRDTGLENSIVTLPDDETTTVPNRPSFYSIPRHHGDSSPLGIDNLVNDMHRWKRFSLSRFCDETVDRCVDMAIVAAQPYSSAASVRPEVFLMPRNKSQRGPHSCEDELTKEML